MIKNFWRRKSNVYKLIALVGLWVAFCDGAKAQNVNFVGSATLFGKVDGASEYRYTKKVHLRDGFSINSSDGRFVIRPVDVSPPPSPDQNYVRVETPKVATDSEYDLTNYDGNDKRVSYSYSDGVGRKSFTASAQSGPEYEDVVQHYDYDPITGRTEESYLPFVTKQALPGAFLTNAKDETMDFYASAPTGVASDSKPYAKSTYDARGRMQTTTAPGEAWHVNNKENIYNYGFFDPAQHGSIAHWRFTNDKLGFDRHYGANELRIATVEDPEGKLSRTVTDGRGLTITSQVYDGALGKWTGSFRVYDEFGRLRYIIPPYLADIANANSSITDLDNKLNLLAFKYEYDGRGRIIKEKAPSSGWKEYVYDNRNRLVLSSHEAQSLNGKKSWTFRKYDALNRLVVTGQLATNNDREVLQQQVDNLGASFELTQQHGDLNTGYTLDRTYPDVTSMNTNDYELFTINYFDNYYFLNTNNWDEEGLNFSFQNPPGFSEVKANNTIDLPTGNKTKILGSDSWLNSVIYYDQRHRAIQTVTENHLGGVDRITSELDWKGELQREHHAHMGLESLSILYEYEYDHAGRILKDYHTIEGQSRVLMSEYHYNTLGELIEKNLHAEGGSPFLQSIDYRYNIRGWLTNINDPQLRANTSSNNDSNDVFGMGFNYTESETVGGVQSNGRYDGLIASMEWKADNRVDDHFKRTITAYQYDDKNQLVGTDYATHNGSSWSGNAQRYEMNASYDDNGNIQTLTRNGTGGQIDDLEYTYSTENVNKLLNVKDNSGNSAGLDDFTQGMDYGYNSMGNMTFDPDKTINNISYNHLQLVSSISFGDQTKIQYTYDAAGIKLSKQVIDGSNKVISRIDYLGTIEYLDGAINQIFTGEGRAYKQAGKFHYEYFITDHQQNTRVAFGNLPDRNVYNLTAEDDRDAYEESHFAFDPAQRINLHNHTPLGNESIHLNGMVANRRIGPTKVLDINANDEVSLEVWAKYGQNHWDDGAISGFLAAVLSGLPASGAGLTGENATSALSSNLNDPGAVGLFGGANNRQPSAYLQYIFFDDQYRFVSELSGYQAVTDEAYQTYTKLASGKLTFDRPGHLLVYLANESNENAEVYFDDLKILHESSNTNFKVSQVNEYYPYGLITDNSWRADGYMDPGLLYQSSYATLDSLTGYYDFLSRSYDPALGRFFAVDPAGQFASPYLGMGNAPHASIDPDGEFALGVVANGLLKLGSSLLVNTGLNAFSAAVSGLNGSSFNDAFLAGGFSANSSFNLFGSNSDLSYKSHSGPASSECNECVLFGGPEGFPESAEEGAGILRNGYMWRFRNGDWWPTGRWDGEGVIFKPGITVTPGLVYKTTNPSLSGNNRTGYIWDEMDLKVWNKLKNDKSPIGVYLRYTVSIGRYEILSARNYWEINGTVQGSLMLFDSYYGMMSKVNGHNRGVGGRYTRNSNYINPGYNARYGQSSGGITNSTNANNTNTSLTHYNTRIPTTARLPANYTNSFKPTFQQFVSSTGKIGSFRGYNGRGTNLRAAWTTYKQLYGE